MELHYKLMLECLELSKSAHNDFFSNHNPDDFTDHEREMKKLNSLSLLDQAFTCSKLAEYHYRLGCPEDNTFEHLLNYFKIFNKTMHLVFSTNNYLDALDETLYSFVDYANDIFEINE